MVMPGGGAAIIIARVLVGGAIAQITGGIGDGGGGGGGGGVLYKSAPVTHCVCLSVCRCICQLRDPSGVPTLGCVPPQTHLTWTPVNGERRGIRTSPGDQISASRSSRVRLRWPTAAQGVV